MVSLLWHGQSPLGHIVAQIHRPFQSSECHSFNSLAVWACPCGPGFRRKRPEPPQQRGSPPLRETPHAVFPRLPAARLSRGLTRRQTWPLSDKQTAPVFTGRSQLRAPQRKPRRRKRRIKLGDYPLDTRKGSRKLGIGEKICLASTAAPEFRKPVAFRSSPSANSLSGFRLTARA